MLELDQPAEISVEDTEPVIIKQLLKYLYIGRLDQDFTDYKEMIILANKYGLRELVDFTSLKLLDLEQSHDATELGIFGEIHNSTVLLNFSANFFLKTMSIPKVLKQDMKKYPKLMLAIILAKRQQELGNVTEFTLFENVSPMWLNYEECADSLRFKVSQRAILVGIGLNGSKGRNHVDLRLGDENTWFEEYDEMEKKYFFPSAGDRAHTKVQLSKGLELEPDKFYDITAHIWNPNMGNGKAEVWRGKSGRHKIRVKEMMVIGSYNRTGLIAAIYLEPV